MTNLTKPLADVYACSGAPKLEAKSGNVIVTPCLFWDACRKPYTPDVG
jgi:hypothetical protein